MKKYLILITTLSLLAACKREAKQEPQTPEKNYQSYGASISPDDAMSVSQLAQLYATLKAGDSVTAKFTGDIEKVCQKKGCWFTVQLDEKQTLMVRFKDYGFFIPKDVATRGAIVEGIAFLRETSVAELQHFAQDAGKPQAEIDAITQPKWEIAFEASGLLIEK